MNIDWSIVATVATPILALFVGAALNRFIERRPKLLVYIAHTSAFRLAAPPHGQVHTHSIVIRNAGKRTAHDIHVSHFVLPENFNVFPDTEYEVRTLLGGGSDLIFSTFPPGFQLTISYLYFPPLLFNQINSFVRHRRRFCSSDYRSANASVLALDSPKSVGIDSTRLHNRGLLRVSGGEQTVLYFDASPKAKGAFVSESALHI